MEEDSRAAMGEESRPTMEEEPLSTTEEGSHLAMEEEFSTTTEEDSRASTEDDAPDATALLENLLSNLRTSESTELFAVGGSIRVQDIPSKRIDLRWSTGAEQSGQMVSLPVSDEIASLAAFAALVKCCTPATFGRGKEEVMDEEYRKAGKMDTGDFCTSFNLAGHQIIDAVNQTLVHRYSKHHKGLEAEMYKLNIYSAPSGKFHPHVDTPQSSSHMGSLVVCLPQTFKGGNLVVRHKSQEINFDWSSDSAETIQWAAFYSDCEHEVLEVTEGHRVTLTYNLYWTKFGPSHLATDLQSLDQSRFHFFAALEKLINCPQFLPYGGCIGYVCSHAYPHTSSSAIPNLVRTLKGIDMMVYQALQRLTGNAQVRAVLDGSHYDDMSDDFGCDTFGLDAYGLESELYDESEAFTTRSHLSTRLRRTVVRSDFDQMPLDEPGSMADIFPSEKIVWLNGPPKTFSELAVAYLTYGNEPQLEAYYSTTAIVCEV